MTYKFIDESGLIVSDGKGWSGMVTAPEVEAWIAAGNTPQAADTPAFAEAKEAKLAEFRAYRLDLLGVISGMGWAALVASDMATATALATFRQGLLDLPQHGTVTAATNITTLSIAMAVRYKQLSDALPVDVKNSFKDLV